MSWAQVMRDAARETARRCKVGIVEADGWQWRGHGRTPGRLLGTMWHDTVTPYSWTDGQLLRLLRDGYSSLPGPIANVGVGSNGTLLLVAAGRAYHAGAGSWPGIPSGNLNAMGIEVQSPGRPTVWRARQLEVVRVFVEEVHRAAGLPASRTVGHKDWAPSRKQDPWSVNMAAERSRLAGRLAGKDEVLNSAQEKMLREVHQELTGGRDAPAADGRTTIRTRTWQSNSALGRLEKNLPAGLVAAVADEVVRQMPEVTVAPAVSVDVEELAASIVVAALERMS